MRERTALAVLNDSLEAALSFSESQGQAQDQQRYVIRGGRDFETSIGPRRKSWKQGKQPSCPVQPARE